MQSKPLQTAKDFIIHAIVLIWTACVCASHGFAADASWFIDESLLHVSVHGRLSCSDCHGAVVEDALHPDPELVTGKSKDFFRVDQCIECHDSVIDGIRQGRHGSLQVTDSDKYLKCIQCHDPHYDSLHEEIKESVKPGSTHCSTCHEQRETLPPSSSEDKACVVCHGAVDPADPKAAQKIAGFCFHCHAGKRREDKKPSETGVPFMEISQYTRSPHAKIPCSACHPDSARSGHVGKTVPCLECHTPHHEKVTHDMHAGISCEACHVPRAVVIRDRASGLVQWRKGKRPGYTNTVHSLSIDEKNDSCKRCHFNGNRIGAASMVLPARSIMCMPCHAATFSADDTVTRISLIAFLLGLLSIVPVWISGTIGTRNGVSSFTGFFRTSPAKIFSVIKTLVLDALLQRRLYRQSVKRWIIHGLIFFPFAFRFTWGVVALFTSLWIPQWAPAWKMLNKNDSACAFLFDLTGVMVITGVCLAVMRRFRDPKGRLPGLPKADWPAYGLLGTVFVAGFILEGMRIAMTGSPEGATYAFLGYAVSRLFLGADLNGVYGYMWYLHAMLTGAFVIYLPFSRMFHMLMAPVSLAIGALSQDKH